MPLIFWQVNWRRKLLATFLKSSKVFTITFQEEREAEKKRAELLKDPINHQIQIKKIIYRDREQNKKNLHQSGI